MHAETNLMLTCLTVVARVSFFVRPSRACQLSEAKVSADECLLAITNQCLQSTLKEIWTKYIGNVNLCFVAA